MGIFRKKETQFLIKSVSDTKTRELESLKDGVFSEKMMGDGIVVCSKDNGKMTIHSPISGEVVVAFPTKHAFGIKAKNGVELLVHIGIDTVTLNGEGFESVIKQGQNINAGDVLAIVDVDLVKSKVPTLDTIVIVTSGQKVDKQFFGNVTLDTNLFEVI